MRVKQWVAAVSMMTLVTGSGIAGAAPTWAAGTSSGCDFINGLSKDSARSPTYTVDPSGGLDFYAGETVSMIVVEMISGDTFALAVEGAPVASGSGTSGTVSYTFGADRIVASVGAQNDDSWTGSFECAAAPAPSGTTSFAVPAWVQAYGRDDAAASCEDGWSPSWQSWAEPVTGGWVCTRSIPSLG